MTRTQSGRAELILTLPAENAHHAEHQALALVKATGHRPIRLEVMSEEEYDCRNGPQQDDHVRHSPATG
jgi:hypothetical protein